MKSKHVGGLLLSEQLKVYFSKRNMMYPCPAVLSIQTNSVAGNETKCAGDSEPSTHPEWKWGMVLALPRTHVRPTSSDNAQEPPARPTLAPSSLCPKLALPRRCSGKESASQCRSCIGDTGSVPG